MLISVELAGGSTPSDAFKAVLAKLQGAFALAVIVSGDDDIMLVARRGSPLAVGRSDGEAFIGSDAIALAPFTNKVTYLDEGDWAILTRASTVIFDEHNRTVERAVIATPASGMLVDKGNHRHFMAKEIAEQPEAVSSAMRRRVDFDDGAVDFLELPYSDDELRSFDRVILSGMGTSLHSCMYGAQMIEALTGIPAQAENASELRYRSTSLNERTLVISVTQSGETADTLAAMELATESGAKQISLVEAEGTQATLVADGTLYLGAGQEIGVASTKTMMCSLTVLYQLAVYLGIRRGTLSTQRARELVSDLSRLPGLVGEMIDDGGRCEQLATDRLVDKQHLLYLGRGALHPMAMEGALKMKELAYIHAEGYPAGEMKHGPIALISDDMPTVALAPQGALYDKMVGNINEVKARGGEVIVLATCGDTTMPGLADEVLWVPEAPEWIVPMITLIPMQQLAYHTSVALGHNPDKPRNLAKSVTVE